MVFGSHAIVSQGAYLCGATHDLDDPAFPLLAYAMTFGPYSWVCARAPWSARVSISPRAPLLGLASVATRSLDAWTVYAGSPAVAIRERPPHLARLLSSLFFVIPEGDLLLSFVCAEPEADCPQERDPNMAAERGVPPISRP